MRLKPWRAGDLALLRQLYGDPSMMEHLGDPESDERLADRQARYERPEAPGEGQTFTIVEAATGRGIGWVGYWPREWRREQVYEIGWSVLPSFQGRGVASVATAQALSAVAAARRHRFVHAFPSVGNPPSNAICRTLGFTLVAACDVEYPPAHLMRCNDWRLELSRRR